MDSIYLFLYGVIQGITEFLPISSSAHLALIPKFTNLKDPGVTFDLLMHLGTALSIFVYFYKDFLRLGKVLIPAFNIKKEVSHSDTFWMRNFIISTFATLLLVLGLKTFAMEFGRAKVIIAINLMFFGVLMFVMDFWKSNEYQNDKMENTLCSRESFLIGLSQALAIFPGVSRSGITLTMGRYLGLSRHEASRYSFLLSTPIIFIGLLVELPKWLEQRPQFSMIECLLGVGVSFIFGIITIHFFLKMINKLGLGIFAIYRVILGIILLVY